MSGRRYTIACLAGNGVGPELMAEASRALAAVAHAHGLALEELHVPFGAEALIRTGHPLPASTRRAYREADAVLLAAGSDPTAAVVESDLDPHARVARVRAPGADVCLVSPLGEGADDWAVELAFELACVRRGHLTAVDGDKLWRERVAVTAEDCPGLQVEQLPLAAALPPLAVNPGHFDVVVSERPLTDALVRMAAFAAAGRSVAFAHLSPRGPGLFSPGPGPGEEDAGQGVVDPKPMLLAAALLLGDGLGERAAAKTLERALTAAGGGSWTGTRELTEAVLAVLPASMATAEFTEDAAA